MMYLPDPLITLEKSGAFICLPGMPIATIRSCLTIIVRLGSMAPATGSNRFVWVIASLAHD